MLKTYRFWCLLIAVLLCSLYGRSQQANHTAVPGHRGHHHTYQPCRLPPIGACDNPTKILPDGRWCLAIEPNKYIAPGRPLARHHIAADDGIAKTLAEIIPSTDSIIDVGAGIGQYQVWFMNNNKYFKRYLAYDGAPNVEEFTFGTVRYLNLAQPVMWLPHELSDWAVSLEVGEHLDKQLESIFLHNLHRVNTKGMCMSNISIHFLIYSNLPLHCRHYSVLGHSWPGWPRTRE